MPTITIQDGTETRITVTKLEGGVIVSIVEMDGPTGVSVTLTKEQARYLGLEAAPTDEPAEVARLKAANRELRTKLNHMKQFYEAEQNRKGIMTQATYGAIMRCLHPDQPEPTLAQRVEACNLFSQWRKGANR